jgi:hypothetical protein
VDVAELTSEYDPLKFPDSFNQAGERTNWLRLAPDLRLLRPL